MQIVKSDHNSQLRQDKGTHLRKMNLYGSIVRKLKKRPSVSCASSVGRSCGNTMTGRHHWGHDGIPRGVATGGQGGADAPGRRVEGGAKMASGKGAGCLNIWSRTKGSFKN